MRISNFEDFRKMQNLYKSSLEKQHKKVIVCAGTGCVANGSMKIYEEIKRLVEEKGILAEVDLEKEHEGIGVKKSGCHGFCEKGPLVRIEPEKYLYVQVKVEDCEEIVNETLINNRPIERLMYHYNDKVFNTQESIPFYEKQTRLVL